MKSPLILASTSIYRKDLLGKLGIDFICEKPICNEDILKEQLIEQKKSPVEIASALAFAKGNSVREQLPHGVIIASDQLVSIDNSIIGKPHTREQAHQQLRRLSGKTHDLITAVVFITPQQTFKLDHISKMTIRNLTDREIFNYLAIDNPIDCAGSYKIENSGIGLFSNIETSDFTAIQGLPLIWISNKLKEMGYELFSQNK